MDVMKKRSVITILITLFNLSCGNDDSDNSPLLGTWITESCAQAVDSNDAPIDLWLVGLYKFTVDSTIQMGHRHYSDSDCTLHIKTQSPSDLDVPVTYEDTGEQRLQEGIDGRGLTINFGEADNFIVTDGFYVINEGSLCFSDAFSFEPARFGVSESGSIEIDFEHCLTRP
jgi:hypothetical protein